VDPTIEIIELLEREDIEQARRMSPSEKLRAGGDLFDEACRWLLAGIRNDLAGISDADAHQELLRRLALAGEQGDSPWARPIWYSG
jgi:hypothetical protein